MIAPVLPNSGVPSPEVYIRPQLRTSNRLRVCHVSLTLKTGGLERLLVDFARKHDGKRFELEYVAMSEIGRFADDIRARGCKVHQLTSTGRFGRVWELAKLLRHGNFDVVHTHNTYPHIYATMAAKLAGVKVVVNTRHGQRIGHGWKARCQYRFMSRFVDRIVAVSEDARKLTLDVDGVRASKVMRIWNGIDVDQFAFRGPAQRPVAITVCRLCAEKDIATMLRAVAIAVKKVPDLKLLIVGDGPERESLERLRSELGLDEVVRMLGDCPDVPTFLAQAGFFVSSSISEGISLTLLEAMAVGLPLVATAVGGTPEIIDQGITGYLVPAANPEALGAAIIEMCDRRNEWHQMGTEGRRAVSERFEITRMVREYESLYEKLVGVPQAVSSPVQLTV